MEMEGIHVSCVLVCPRLGTSISACFISRSDSALVRATAPPITLDLSRHGSYRLAVRTSTLHDDDSDNPLSFKTRGGGHEQSRNDSVSHDRCNRTSIVTKHPRMCRN